MFGNFLRKKIYGLLENHFDDVLLEITKIRISNNSRDTLLENRLDEIIKSFTALETMQEEQNFLLENKIIDVKNDSINIGLRLDELNNDYLSLKGSLNKFFSGDYSVFQEKFDSFARTYGKVFGIDVDKERRLEGLPRVNYLKFEDKFRGSEELIMERQQVFLEYFLESTHVVDLGCGRGEFLKLLKDKNINAFGVDIDGDMVKYCTGAGLRAYEADMFNFLLDAKDNEFDGVFSSQVIEHISYNDLQNLFALLRKKVRKDAPILLETPNYHCREAMERFFTDLSHQKPILPEVISFIAEEYGFKVVEFIFSSPVDPKHDLNTKDYSKASLYGDYAVILKS